MQSAKPLAGKTILVVDDDAAIRLLISHVLTAAGARVLLGIDGIEGEQKLLGDENIDVLVTDLAMPGLNGVELARRADKVRPGLPIVFATGSLDCFPDTREEIVCLPKPFTRNELLDAVERALNARLETC